MNSPARFPGRAALGITLQALTFILPPVQAQT